MDQIVSVKARTVRVPLDKPVSFSTRSIDARMYTLVRVECADGSSGIGFCHGSTNSGELSTMAVRELIRPMLLGQDPHRTEGLWKEVYQHTLLNGRAGAVMRAISAVDNALWDRNSRKAGLPLHRYLGSARDKTVPAYASGGYYYGGDETKNIAAEIERYAAAGFTAVKIKVGGRPPSEDVERVRVSREIIGPDGILMLDANNAWNDLPSALRLVELIKEYRPYLIEEPFGPEDFENHARLAQAANIPLATGELLAGRWSHHACLVASGVSVLQPDACVCGGITEWRRVAATAASLGIPVMSHSFPDLNAHVISSAPNGAYVEYFMDHSILPFGKLLDNRLEFANGELILTTSPGVGFGFDEGAVTKYSSGDWM